MKTKTLCVEISLGNLLEKWCDEPPVDGGCPVIQGEVLFDREVTFDDGNRLAVQAIASEDLFEPIWTQGVLFSPEGAELGFTEVGDSFWGEYEVGGYTCLVTPATDSER